MESKKVHKRGLVTCSRQMNTLMKGVSRISRVFDDSGGYFSLKNIGEVQGKKKTYSGSFPVAAAVLQNNTVQCVAPVDSVLSRRRRKHYCQVLN